MTIILSCIPNNFFSYARGAVLPQKGPKRTTLSIWALEKLPRLVEISFSVPTAIYKSRYPVGGVPRGDQVHTQGLTKLMMIMYRPKGQLSTRQ